MLEEDLKNLDDMPLVTGSAKSRLDQAAGVAAKETGKVRRMLEEAQDALGESESGGDPSGYPFPPIGSGEIWNRLRQAIKEDPGEHSPGQRSGPDPKLGAGRGEPESLESLLGFKTELPRELI